MVKEIDFVLITTQRYNNLIARDHRGESISADEWIACAADLLGASTYFKDDRATFCNDRAKDCEMRAWRAREALREAPRNSLRNS